MKFSQGTVLTAAAVFLVLGTFVSPAQAESIWKTGDQVGAPNWTEWDPPAFAVSYDTPSDGSQPKCGPDSVVFVKRAGDYLFVKDTCKDGRSAVGRVSWSPNEYRTCRNPYGRGTWARCNFDWPENEAKVAVGGVYNGSTGFRDFDSFGQVIFNQ
jgi:hypothetical protein